MRRAALISSLLSSVGLVGCFYVDPINQRPSLDIRPDSSEPVYRKDTILLHAIAADPEKQFVGFQWRAYVCTDATTEAGCDAEPYYTGTEPDATFLVPAFRVDPDGTGPLLPAPNEAMRVILDGMDDHGATARPSQELPITVLNHPPELEVRKVATHGAVINTPIDLFAKYGDPDDTFDNVTVEWTAFSPSQVPDTLTDIAVPQDPSDPDHRQVGKRLIPTVTGEWDIRVVATDRFGAPNEKPLIVTVVDDTPPCLDTLLPIASPGGELYPLTEQTLFQVAVAADDLDVYPPVPSDAILGTTRFEWSLKLGGGPRQVLATAGNSVAVDPASYVPGTTFELRVQIFDRKNVPILCADAAQTCAVIASNPTCIQRQTWHVEVR